MDPNDPILDQPQEIEYGAGDGQANYRLANHDIFFYSDPNSDLFELQWPWANEEYVKSIRIAIDDPRGEELMPLVTRYFPGYQETILGNEGMIISKRITAPLGIHYDRSALWTLECQAEGDRLFRLVIDIDWGEPLTQRIIDGLLVAQRNPTRAQGIYKQRNADWTCVFGNPLGRPSSYQFDDQGHAQLTYYVLVNGIVDVSLVLTVSDVGEQVAWNGFLALRDAEREFEDSTTHWAETIQTGRLWTSHPQLNRAVQVGRTECLRHIQRMRTGLAPTSRRIEDFPALIRCCDTMDVTLSRNLLAHLRRLAIRSDGRLPLVVPTHPKEALEDAGAQFAKTNYTYILACQTHFLRHPDDELRARHYEAIKLCAESMVRQRWSNSDASMVGVMHWAAKALEAAVAFAALAEDDVNVARWSTESKVLRETVLKLGGSNGDEVDSGFGAGLRIEEALDASSWRHSDSEPLAFADAKRGIALAGDVVWSVCHLEWYDGTLWVYPNRIEELRWWALIEYPIEDKRITLVWDGETLHTTYPVGSSNPVSQVDLIRVRGADEHGFDLHFDMIELADTEVARRRPKEIIVHQFRPEFEI